MASGQHADALKLTPEELKRSGSNELPGAPIVHVEGVEDDRQKSAPSPRRESTEEAHHQKPAVTHETETLKTTVREEEDDPPKASFVDKVRGKAQQVGDKLRPHNAVHAKEQDPHPALT